MTSPAAPAPMEGGGAYNRNSRVQASGLAPAIDWFAEAAAAASTEGTGPVVIADYGSSEGLNSLAPVAAAIAALRPRIGPTRAISVLHTDLPGNDWGALFALLAADPGSYLAPNVFPAAVGRSFYEQILPAASVALGWSSWATQWLSRIPGPIPDQVQVAFSRDPAARTAYAAQADADWRAFLAARAAELVPGGRLVVLTMARDAGGDFGYGPLLAALYAALGDLVAEGLVRPEEKARMAIPTVGRGAAELAAPFADGGALGLGLARLEVFAAEDRIWADYAASGDAAVFGVRWASFSRASVFPTLAAALDGPEAPARRSAFVARLADGLADRLAAAPCPMKIPLARMEILRDRA